MTSSRSPLAPHIQAFFTDHLCHHKRVSPQTLASCRDSFRLLLTFVKETVGIEPSALCQRFIGCGLFDSSEEDDLLERIGTQL